MSNFVFSLFVAQKELYAKSNDKQGRGQREKFQKFNLSAIEAVTADNGEPSKEDTEVASSSYVFLITSILLSAIFAYFCRKLKIVVS